MAKNKISKETMLVAWVVVFGAMAPLLDSTMMNIAINSLVRDLNSTVTTVQWTITGYLLATGIAVPFSSWLINKFDGKYVFLSGEILFALGSTLSAMSPNINFLIGARLVQGFAGGLIMPLLTTLLVQTAGADSMGEMMATVGLPIILGPLLGPVIGGIIIKFLSWRWIFWVNIPVAIISIALILWKMPNYPAQNKHAKLDIVGISLLVISSSSIIYGMVKAAHQATFTNKTTVTFLIIGFLSLVLYVGWALLRRKYAVIPLKLFSFASFDGSAVGLFIAGTLLNGAMLLLPLYFQNVDHMSVIMAALALFPQGLGMLIVRPLVGRLTDSIGAKYVVLVSTIITFVGTVPFYWINQNTNYWIVASILLIRGIGAGGIFTPLMADSYTGMQKSDVPSATVGTRIIQNIGSAFGSALITTLVTSYSKSQVNNFEKHLSGGKYHVAPSHLADFVHTHLVNIRLESFQYGFLMISFAALIMLIPTIFLSDKRKSM